MAEKKTDEVKASKKIESKYNANKLREAIKAGHSAVQIMEMLGIKHKQTLKQYVLKLISNDRQFYEIPGLYLKNSSKPKVSKNGLIKIKIENIDLGDLKLNEEDEFNVTVEGNKIILEKI